jgi:hypothetical protein
MHKKYADRGLAVVTVTLDDATDDATRAKVVKFLKERKAVFPNLLLDEPAEVWQKKFRYAGVPFFFVFNREGKYRSFDATGIDEDLSGIEKLVVDWLQLK